MDSGFRVQGLGFRDHACDDPDVRPVRPASIIFSHCIIVPPIIFLPRRIPTLQRRRSLSPSSASPAVSNPAKGKRGEGFHSIFKISASALGPNLNPKSWKQIPPAALRVGNHSQWDRPLTPSGNSVATGCSVAYEPRIKDQVRVKTSGGTGVGFGGIEWELTICSAPPVRQDNHHTPSQYCCPSEHAQIQPKRGKRAQIKPN